MGQLVDGKWQTTWYEPDEKGRFQRPKTRFRSWLSADGSTDFRAEAGRYHLYVAYACPWAHRTLITRALRGLEDAISVTVVDPHMGPDGWPFREDDPDPLGSSGFLRDVYLRAKSDYTGRVTVPVLWDRQKSTIVNNESREIMRMLDTECDALAKDPRTLAPPALCAKIDETLDAIYEPINNGVYRAGFATKQSAYEDACRTLFEALDHWERVLETQRFLCGDVLTEADVAMFTTLLRFDLVYYAHFKCNVRRVQDYPSLWGFVRDVYQIPGVRETCDLDDIKTHYYWSQDTVNPTRIVPLGPTLELDAPHDRARLGSGDARG
ncbi:MAG: glutathione S-transferase family protein [Myxococcota bacterium]|nr:glutathione S-transferase family protein [Myxococcota bacterium]